MPLKVIARNTDFDATMMAQGELGKPLPPATRGGGITIDGKALQAAEQFVAGADDGEFFLPVGTGQNSDRQLEISLERLPEPVSEGERSLQGSIRILFQKVISTQLKQDLPYPLLSAVNVQVDGTIDPYDTIEASVKEQVAQANRIVLFIHGIIGDTKSMVPSVQRAKIEVNGQLVPLVNPNVYDLVLAFDYENLNTSIADNARSLKQRLEAVGLGKGHDKTVHIVAHSMGGLVSRWFIEREGGKDIVSHLIMLGTPNNGSPWPNVMDFALPLLLNGLAAVAWPVSAIGALMPLSGAERQMTTTLKEMQPDSTLVNTLFSSEPPGIPYTIIAGNTSLIQPKNPASQAKIKALLQRVGKFVVESPFMGVANDTAVTVNSITHLPERTPAPNIIPIACDHLTYFTNPIGLAALAMAVSNAMGYSDLDAQAAPLAAQSSSQSHPPSGFRSSVESSESGELSETDTKAEFSHSLLVAPSLIASGESRGASSFASLGPTSNGVWIKVMAGVVVIVAMVGFLLWQMSQRKNASQPNMA